MSGTIKEYLIKSTVCTNPSEAVTVLNAFRNN